MGSLAIKIREGRGPVWGTAKRTARAILSFHIPVNAVTRPLFRAAYALHVAAREWTAWALRFFWYEPLFRSQCESVGRQFQMEKLPYILGRGRIVIGSRVRLSGKPSLAFANRCCPDQIPELRIGDGTFIGHECSFGVARSVRIGDHCLLAGGVRMQDYDGHPLDAERRRAGEPNPGDAVRPITIGDDVWIGNGALVLKGVTLGDRCVVGSKSVVTKSFPPDVVIAGNPARIVKFLKDPDRTPELHNGEAPARQGGIVQPA